MSRRTRESVVVVGPVPPPVHGAARVTDRMSAAIAADAERVVTVDTSAHRADGSALSPLARAGRLLGGLVTVLRETVAGSGVYVGGAGGALLWFQAVILLIARIAGSRVVFHHHSFAYVAQRDPAMATLILLGGPRVLHVVLGESMAVGLRSTYPSVREVLVCSNAGVLPPSDCREQERVGDGIVLGHLSNLSIAKGLRDVVEAFERVRRRDPEARLVLAGPVSDAETEQVLAEVVATYGASVEVTGPVPADAVDAVYRRVDLFCFPSRYVHEAEPLVVLDALRHGVPVVAYAVGCLGELVPGEHLVPLDADYAAAVVRAAESVPDRATPVGSFDDRRAAALAAYEEIVVRLLGG